MGGGILASQISPLLSGTAVATTSGTSVDFTGLPSWVKRITVMFSNVSTSGTSNILVRLITSAGVISTGYRSSSSRLNGSSVGESDSTVGFLLNIAAALDDVYGTYTIATLDGTAWSGSGSATYQDGLLIFGGGIVLAGALTGVRITTVNGTDTFDTGLINVLYE
jgi:hypothetical protein